MDKNCITLELNKIIEELKRRCMSEAGRVLANDVVPATDLTEAAVLVNRTEDAYNLIARFGSPSFSGVKDVSNSLARANAGGMLTMKELLAIASLLRTVKGVLDWRSHCEGAQTTLQRYFENLIDLSPLERKISSSILSDDEMHDNASPELFKIRRKIISAENKVRDKLDSLIRSDATKGCLQEAVVTIRNGRYVVPVKAEFRSHISGLIHDTSSSGATVFVEPMGVVEANNEIRVLHSQEQDEIERILFVLSGAAAENADTIKYSFEILAELDLVFAKAKLAYDMKASVPILNGNGIVDLKKARHPLLDPKKVVPVDITLGENYKVLIITGPNTGGKTVALKTTGLICLMAACGMMIPCADNSKVAVFSRVLADIGDEQSIEQSLSTFSSHIKNITSILQQTDRNTLVLLDELCSGTDPVEGAALATSLLETLKNSGAIVGATTHYAELKTYALDTENVENACCEFDVISLKPTYRLLIGVPGRSNAFAISKRLGISDEIIDRAKTLVDTESTRFERIVGELEKSRKNYEERYEQMQQALEDAEKQRAAAIEQSEKLKAEYDRKIDEANSTARAIADDARAKANRLIDELEKLKKDKNADISKVRAAAKSGFKDLDKVSSSKTLDDGYVLPRPLKIGDDILLRDINRNAVVLKEADQSGNVLVQAGIVKMKVPLSNIKLIEQKKSEVPYAKHSFKGAGADGKTVKRASMEIDIRGMNVDEGVIELDRFIDGAVLNKIGSFSIIHGKGTGALRAGVHKYLKTNKFVKSFRLGVFGEGESGVTIVELK